MSCSPFDLRDYFLQELTSPQQRQVEAHLRGCEPCCEELDRLRITGAALRTAAEEEIPQRIAFISDKVFEPSPWRRWLAAFWNSGARLGFVSAAMLSASLLVYAVRPAPAASQAEINRLIQTSVTQAVAKAVVQTTAEQTERIQQLNAELQMARKQLLMAADEYEMSQKRLQQTQLSAANWVLPVKSRGDSQ